MASRYSRLQTTEPSESEQDIKKKKAERVERISAKVNALFWVAVACGTIYYVDFFQVAFHDDRVKRWPFNMSVACLSMNIGLACYLVLYLPIVLGIKDHKMWEVHCPNVIPLMTFLGLSCIVLMNVAFWPVWGLLTPVLVFLLMMGFLLVGHFLPSFW